MNSKYYIKNNNKYTTETIFEEDNFEQFISNLNKQINENERFLVFPTQNQEIMNISNQQKDDRIAPKLQNQKQTNVIENQKQKDKIIIEDHSSYPSNLFSSNKKIFKHKNNNNNNNNNSQHIKNNNLISYLDSILSSTEDRDTPPSSSISHHQNSLQSLNNNSKKPLQSTSADYHFDTLHQLDNSFENLVPTSCSPQENIFENRLFQQSNQPISNFQEQMLSTLNNNNNTSTSSSNLSMTMKDNSNNNVKQPQKKKQKITRRNNRKNMNINVDQVNNNNDHSNQNNKTNEESNISSILNNNIWSPSTSNDTTFSRDLFTSENNNNNYTNNNNNNNNNNINFSNMSSLLSPMGIADETNFSNLLTWSNDNENNNIWNNIGNMGNVFEHPKNKAPQQIADMNLLIKEHQQHQLLQQFPDQNIQTLLDKYADNLTVSQQNSLLRRLLSEQSKQSNEISELKKMVYELTNQLATKNNVKLEKDENVKHGSTTTNNPYKQSMQSNGTTIDVKRENQNER